MRHFVTNIACGKNEFIDTSALRYPEPVKLYLAALRNGHDAEKREDNAVCETASSARSADMSLGSEALTSKTLPKVRSLLTRSRLPPISSCRSPASGRVCGPRSLLARCSE